ncbi:MAG: hypothetical protein KAI39_08685 [Desulfobulbaceae bacterium]|nr:hypothetical protein [Desulfobulbaceae bacterium]
MKRNFIIVFLLTVVAGTAFYLTRPFAPPLSSEYYADYLPADTLATISLIDLKGLSHSFPLSIPGKFVSKPTMRGIMTELKATTQDIESYNAMYDGLADVMTNPAFRQIFGDDTVVALLPPDLTRLQTDRNQEIQRSLLIFGTSSVTGPLESFARLVMSKSVSRETVDGFDMTRIQLEDDEEIYGYVQDTILILSYNPNTIVTAIEQKQKENNLQQTDSFKEVKQFWSEKAAGREYSQTYINMAAISTLLSTAENREARDIAQLMHGLYSIGSLIIDQQGELQVSTRLNYDFDSLNKLFKQQFRSLSNENLSLNLLTPETLAYYWTSTLDKDTVREMLSTNGEQQYQQTDAHIQEELGLPLEDLLEAIGPQTGIVINDVVKGMLFPLPKIIFYLQIRDSDIASQVLETLRQKIAARGFAAEKSEEVNGHTIFFWSVLPGEATQPAIVLTDNMLYIANGKSSLKSLLTKELPADPLPAATAETLGSELTNNIKASNHTTFVLRPANLANKGKKGADWITTMLAASKNISAGKLKEEILTLMRSIDIVVATIQFQEDHAESSIVLKHAVPQQQTQ